MDSIELDSVLAVDDCLSFSEAAYQLSFSQSAISKHVSAIEDELGVKLFNRKTHSGVSRTKNGEALIAVASWLPDDRELLISVDREALGIDGDYELYAPPVEGFQDEAVFPSGAPVPIACGKGRMFLVRKK